MKLTPIIPFEPVSADQFPEQGRWVAQIKWDGVRMLVYADGQDVRLVNRKRNDRTMQYPELVSVRDYCSAESVILDGEIIALDKGKPAFHQVMRRDGIRKASSVGNVQREVPITYMVFDILYCNGEWVTGRTLEERQELLAEVIQPNATVQLVSSHSDLQALHEVSKQHDLEGIVVKDVSSKYVIDGKDRRWLKMKWFKDLYAVVGGVTHRAGTVNALLLGLYDEQGKLWYIGHAGTGRLTVQDWKTVTEIAAKLQRDERPFANVPERSKEATWIEPMLSVRVQFMEWTPYTTLRQPSIQSFVEMKPEECTFGQV
ncbi:RNA ligase family protein [Paenibacillus turpanensis]|uniref:ATP-dependent DNA ligase n=1 Tax=Paenibacillus turpanensis TaxID=2689078 RepID=UPI00140C418B|nr:RNA ligase family protein [Paenibacillus turpanensis]